MKDDWNGILTVVGVVIILFNALNSCVSFNKRQRERLDSSPAAPCDYSTGYDSLGRRCGGRSAEVIPGGRLGGTGFYVDPYGRPRLHGSCNDIYDDC